MEINSKAVLKTWELDLKRRLRAAKKVNRDPKLVIVKVGDDYASGLYVSKKVQKARELGITPIVIELEQNVSQYELNETLKNVKDPVILQLPLPKHLNSNEAISHIHPELDVDGLTSYQKGLLSSRDPRAFEPATAKGVIKLIESQTTIPRKKVAIVSRSELIGIPLSHMILARNGFPVILHSKIPMSKIKKEMVSSSIIVTGCGQRGIFDFRHCKSSRQVIIDCSMAKRDGMSGVGDFDKDSILTYTSNAIASGYGHTGPATVLGLMDNVVKYYEMITEDFK